jgi:SWI/SNF-related matrix-associated actin-dependent regulator of chromatin subfamily A-like protein 1
MPDKPTPIVDRAGLRTDSFLYQTRGESFLSARKYALLADEMGLGKSRQAILAADRVGAKTIAIACPASVRPHWPREFRQWSKVNRSVHVVTRTTEELPGADVIVLSYAALIARAIWRQLRARRFDVLIIDEAQFAKSHRAARTKALYGRHCDGAGGLIENCKHTWLLSGTPAPNSVVELWPHLRAFGITDLTFDGFRHHFTVLRETKWGWVPVANRNVPELRELIKPIFLRRRVEQVLAELPPIRTVTTPIEAESGALLELQTDPALAPLRAALAANDDASVLRLIERASGDAIARLRCLTGLTKVPGTIELLHDELESDPAHKVVVFAHHRDVIRGLADGLAGFGAVVLTGETRPAERQAAIDRFATDPTCRVFVANLVAGGTGINLVAAAHVVIVEPSWVPAENQQAIARCRRIGQQRSVLARFLTIPDSLDAGIAAVLARKAAMLGELEAAA